MHIRTAFLSLKPSNVVIVFSGNDAKAFHDKNKIGETNDNHHDWLMLTTPDGLKRAYTARCGDVGFVFDSVQHAKDWYEHLHKHSIHPYWDSKAPEGPKNRTIYLGDRLVQGLQPGYEVIIKAIS